MSARATLLLLIAAGALAGARADAAGLSPNLTIRSTGPVITTFRTPGYGYPSYTPPPAVAVSPHAPVRFNTNDQFDTGGNINPGSGGGGTKPGKKPNLQ
jgi:hypothetical protein